MDIDAMTGVPPPRNRRLWAAVAIILPIVVIGGGAAWFIRTYVAPPMVRIAEPAQLASYLPPAPAAVERAPPDEPVPQAAPEPSRPLPMMSGLNTASVWPSTSPAPAYASADPMFNPPGSTRDASEPIAGPIPLPPPRPRISSAIVRGNVPLPRPRPGATEQD